MNREIKFRVKSTIDGKWIYGLEKPDISIINELSLDIFFRLINVDRKTLGQYIGLKDKNGKEIYEGDITTLGIVKWHSSCWELGEGQKIDGGHFGKVCGELNAKKCEVIGDIYKNNEL